MSKVLVFAGAKQSGKSSGAKFVAGYTMCQLGRKGVPFLPTRFLIDDDGKLIINAVFSDIEGRQHDGEGILDLTRTDPEFKLWMRDIVHPHVKIYSFASYLKEAAIIIFGLDRSKVYGTDEDKNSPTDIKWKDITFAFSGPSINKMKKNGKYDKFMTIREFLQVFGTDICRKIKSNCWVEACFREIAEDRPDLAIIDDGRFENELTVSRDMGAKIIKLDRTIESEDDHDSETVIKHISSRLVDRVIENQEMTISEKNEEILTQLYDWGWYGVHIPLET
jgi:hypothetical protein